MKIRIHKANTDRAIASFFDFPVCGVNRLADYIDELRQAAIWNSNN
jgi:hypothetical protein